MYTKTGLRSLSSVQSSPKADPDGSSSEGVWPVPRGHEDSSSLDGSHEDDRVVLLVATLYMRHRCARGHGEVPRVCVGRGRIACARFVPCCTTREMCHIIECGTTVERPSPVIVDRQDGRCLSTAGHHVPAGLDWKCWRLHDESMLFEPPVVAVESPACPGNTVVGFESLEAFKSHTTRSRVYLPNAPVLGAAASCTPRKEQHCFSKGVKLRCMASVLMLRT